MRQTHVPLSGRTQSHERIIFCKSVGLKQSLSEVIPKKRKSRGTPGVMKSWPNNDSKALFLELKIQRADHGSEKIKAMTESHTS
jgi:hypothetical protein